MVDVNVRITNNLQAFRTNFMRNKNNALDEMGRFARGKENVHAAIDTGFMVSRNEYFVFTWHVQVGNFGCNYAIYQEFGTAKMQEHPFVRKAMFNYQGHLRTICAYELSQGM